MLTAFREQRERKSSRESPDKDISRQSEMDERTDKQKHRSFAINILSVIGRTLSRFAFRHSQKISHQRFHRPGKPKSAKVLRVFPY